MDDTRSPFATLVEFLHHALEVELERHRFRQPGLTVEVGSIEEHGRFIPAIAELLFREERRGTKGMSGSGQSPRDSYKHIAYELERETVVLLRDGDELIGYSTLAPWEVEEGRVIEFCSAVVDDPFRGAGYGRLLVDAREVLVVGRYVPQGYQPIAFCNQNSSRIYNRELWFETPWEWYSRYPVPVVCKPECQQRRSACDCTVMAMNLERLAELAGVDPAGLFSGPWSAGEDDDEDEESADQITQDLFTEDDAYHMFDEDDAFEPWRSPEVGTSGMDGEEAGRADEDEEVEDPDDEDDDEAPDDEDEDEAPDDEDEDEAPDDEDEGPDEVEDPEDEDEDPDQDEKT